MDPIHPIRPTAVRPAAVDAVRRVPRDPDKERERDSGERPPRKPVAQPRPGDDAPLAHVDARV